MRLHLTSLHVNRTLLTSVLLVVFALGITQRTLVQAQPLQAKVYAQTGLVYGGENCPSPPVNFEARHATSSELQYYGLPARPNSEGTDLNNWLDEIHRSLHRICGMGTPKQIANGIAATPNQGVSAAPPSAVSPSATSYIEYTNWSGFDTTGGGFDWVQGQWVTPCYTSPSPSNSRAVQWVGLGGPGNTNLWQGGTETDPTEGYQLWWEKVPGLPQQYVGPRFTCGDTMIVEADYGLTCAGKSYVKFTDSTQGWYWSVPCQSFTPSSSTAEWIDERTSCGAGLFYSLSDFRSTKWTRAQAKSTKHSNTAKPISYFANNHIVMEQNSGVLADPTDLFSDGMSFTNQWYANGTSTC